MQVKALKFGPVGAVNTFVDLSVVCIALVVLGLSAPIANVLAWFVAISGSYLMNGMTTFAAELGRRLTLPTFAGFVASGLAGLVMGTTALLVAAMFLHILVAKFISVALSFGVIFLLSHFLVFRPAKASQVPTGGSPING